MKKTILIFLIAISVYSYGQNTGTTLKICDLEPVDRELQTGAYIDVFTEKCGEGIEAWSKQDYELVKPSFHPFVQAVHYSYAYHRPLTISPDMVWLMIAQGFSAHVNQNPDSLRHYFVDFDGKKVLKVRRNQFIKGSNENDWEGVFPEFTKQIGEYTGEKLLNTTLLNFSTTGNVEKAAFEVTLMEAMSSYFIYAVYTSCGITEITLEGTTEDWKLILAKTKELSKYDLQWWVDDLVPVLEQFIKASNGETDKEFWEQIYKNNSVGSGAPYITGWILKFFPYLKSGKTYTRSDEFDRKVTTGNFPSGISKADFYWLYNGSIYQMEFLAGFVGVKQDEKTLDLRPEIGWAIKDTGEEGIKGKDEEYKTDILTPPEIEKK